MVESALCWVVINRCSRHPRELERLNHARVYLFAQVPHRAPVCREHHWLRVDLLSVRLREHADEVEVVPDARYEVIEVYVCLRGDAHRIRALRELLYLLSREQFALVHDVDRRYVHAVALEHVDEVVDCRRLVEVHHRVADAVRVAQHVEYDLVGQLRLRTRRRDSNAVPVANVDADARRALVELDTVTAELVLEYAQQRQRLAPVEHHKDERARPRDRNDLLTAPNAVRSALEDARQVEDLYLRAVDRYDAGNGRQRCELVRGDLRTRARERVEERRLADGREPEEADARVAAAAHFEAGPGAAGLARDDFDRLALQLRKTSLQAADVAHSGFVDLSARKLFLDLGNLL